jgi:ABC-type bacteriocin/lantibiotic exporter with double-glycine peptidase domain
MKSKFTPWERLVRLLELEKKDLLQILYYAIFSGIVALSLPLGIQAIINLIQGAQISSSWIVLVLLVTLGVIFAGALQIMQLRIIETVQQRIFTRTSFEYSYRFPKIKLKELRNVYPPELANRFFDTLSVQKGLSKLLIDVPTAILQIIFALLLLSFYHPFFIIFGILLLLLIFVVFKYTAVRGLQTSLDESKNKYKVAHWIQEIARSVVSFKLSGNTDLALKKTDGLVLGYLGARESHFRILVIQVVQMITFKVFVTAGLLIIGGALVLTQEMNIGQFVAAEIIILLVIASVEKLIIGLESFYDVLTSLEKLGQVVDKELEPQQGERPDFSGDLTVELENVSYQVSDRNLPILSDISMRIEPGSRLMIQGESGSGKSSLLRMIAGLLEPSSGHMYANQFSVESLYLNHYRQHLGLSLAMEAPFEGTIRENITFGNPDISDGDILEALDQVGLTGFIQEQPKGLSTILHPEGKQISYTVSKKLVLARAIAKHPKLLILEDPLDHFSPKESRRLIDFLTHKDRPWALIVVSDNLYWEEHCHQAIVLEKGKIVESKSQGSC